MHSSAHKGDKDTPGTRHFQPRENNFCIHNDLAYLSIYKQCSCSFRVMQHEWNKACELIQADNSSFSSYYTQSKDQSVPNTPSNICRSLSLTCHP